MQKRRIVATGALPYANGPIHIGHLVEGMVLAAGPGGKDLFILSPDSGAQPGQKVK